MNIIESNINALKECASSIYDNNIKEIEMYDTDNNSVCSVCEAKDGSMYMQYKKDEKVIRLNSNYSPLREAAKWAEQYDFSKNAHINIVMFGLGNGYFVRELLKKISDNSSIIIVEPEKEFFYKVLYEFDITDIISDSRVHILLGSLSEIKLFDVLQVFVYWANVKSLKVLEHPQYNHIYNEYYENYIKVIQDFIINANSEGATEENFGVDIAYNTICNMKYLLDACYSSEFCDIFPDDAVGVVVAAGPSLDKNISVLKELKGKAVIMATDTALRRMYREGIEPDFVVSVDPRKPIQYFENVGFENMTFFCHINSNPQVMNMHSGKKIWCSPSIFQTEIYKALEFEYMIPHMGGSVATNAFGLCAMLGIKNIVLIGQDLAYDGEVTHAGGEVDTSRGKEQTFYVEGNYVDKIETRGDWLIFLKWYERTVKELSEEFNIINATEGGAKIKGTKIMTLREVADTLCCKNIDIDSIINEVLVKENSVDKKNKMYEFFKRCCDDLKVMGKAIDKTITLCNRFERKYAKYRTLNPEVTKCMQDVNKLTEKIGKMPVYLLMDNILMHKDLNSIKEIYNNDDDEYTDNMNMMKNIKHIFELNRETLNEFSERFIKAVDEIGEQLAQDEC